jgi:hypothetical protein
VYNVELLDTNFLLDNELVARDMRTIAASLMYVACNY